MNTKKGRVVDASIAQVDWFFKFFFSTLSVRSSEARWMNIHAKLNVRKELLSTIDFIYTKTNLESLINITSKQIILYSLFNKSAQHFLLIINIFSISLD